MTETRDEAFTRPRRNVWAISCLGLVLTSWTLLAYLALADAVLSTESASSGAFDPVWGLYLVAVLAAPFVGLEALVSIRARGQAWLAWLGFALALVLPALHAIAIISLAGRGIGPPD